jgi:hypothetical protein
MYQKEFQDLLNRNTTSFTILSDMPSNLQRRPRTVINDSDLVFTPTTFASFENNLSSLHDELMATASITNGGVALKSETAANQLWAGKMMCEDDDDDDDDDDEDEDDESSNSVPARKMQKTGQSFARATAASKNDNGDPKPPRKLPGPRPRRNLEDMTPLEAERRRRRRERNKTAAAKCRQRRLDVTNELLAETEMLEREASKLESEIENLQRQKNQLEFVLESHKPLCHNAMQVLRPTVMQIKQERTTPPTTLSTNQFITNSATRPTSLPISSSHVVGSSAPTTTMTSTVLGSIFSFDTATSLTGLTPMFAADMQSPSSFLVLSPTALLN